MLGIGIHIGTDSLLGALVLGGNVLLDELGFALLDENGDNLLDET